MQTNTSFKTHPGTSIVDELSSTSYTQLKADIQANGLLVPIVRVGGKVIDGRARLKACKALSISPKFIDLRLKKGQTVEDAVLSFNLSRRHLELNQRALLAARYSTLKPGTNQHTAAAATQAELAARFDVSVDSIQRALAITRKGIPELVQAVAEGKVDLACAKEIASQETKLQVGLRDQGAFQKDTREILRRLKVSTIREARLADIEKIRAANDSIGAPPTSKFNLIYADPPWDYTKEVELGYPTMKLSDIQALPINQGPKDSILFMWVPASLIADGLAVIEAWGFSYVTCAVWNRGSAAQGVYFRIQHEMLMLAKRGKPPLPLEGCRPLSILNVKKGEHSAKPIEAYEMIESMYPELSKLELFCRGKPRKGWAGWGNECTTSLELNTKSHALKAA